MRWKWINLTILCLIVAQLYQQASGYGIHEQLWLEVLYPSDVAFAYKIRSARNFGGIIARPLRKVKLVKADPEEACSHIVNGNNLRGQVAFIKRGGCSFVSKCLNVELYGAIAAIIADNNPNDNLQWIEMIGDGTNRDTQIGIPAFFMLGKDGDMINNSLKKHNIPNAIVNLPVNYTNGAVINQPPWDFW